jgi:hypothetical protein
MSPTYGRELAEYVEHFRARVLQDALNEATASHWRRRAATFAAVGNARCDEIAQACRNAAIVALMHDGIDADVWAALAEADDVSNRDADNRRRCAA